MLILKNHFSKLNPKKFIILSVVFLLLLDLVNSYYLRIYWGHQNLSLLYVQQIALAQGLDINQLSVQSIQEIKQVIDNGFFLFLIIVLLNNIFFYIFYLRKKVWAHGYVVFYALTNSILAILFIIEGPILGIPWFIYNFLTVFLYFYLFLGFKFLKNETTLNHQIPKMKEQ